MTDAGGVQLGFPEFAPPTDTAAATVPGHPTHAGNPNSSQATTLISELTTALGTVRRTIDEALAHMPSELHGVNPDAWSALMSLYDQPMYRDLFEVSFANGRSFVESPLALRHRQPHLVEWCGQRKIVGEDVIPADIRVDDVYLISCKYNSQHLSNSGPSKLFEHRLRETPTSPSWYNVVAPDQYQAYYAAVRDHFGLESLPARVDDLDREHRNVLKAELPRHLPPELAAVQAEFCAAVATESARRWQASLGNARQRAEFAMSLLRIPQAIYFLLGQRASTPLRFKVLSRWDWAERYQIVNFDVTAMNAKQPTVGWRLDVSDRHGRAQSARGHVEIRWGHGRFNGAPEAKVVLDSDLVDTPGYLPLD